MKRPVALIALLSLMLLLPGSPEAQTQAGAAAADTHQHAPYGSLPNPEDFRFYPEDVDYDPAVPTLEAVVGHDWGERITSPAEIDRYLQAIADAVPARVQLHEYARSWEGRPLWYVVVASPDNMARIDEIRADNLRLADPRETSPEEAETILAGQPVITWLAYGVHGNEISSGDAALRTLYHLAAARGDELTDRILAGSVVVLDPMQNPDGRARFVNHYRQSVGPRPDSDTDSVELSEPWPGGRTNHYLFDLNRDWFAQTQPETRGKVAAFLRWRPHVYIDLHEMGGDSTYYFPPQADPINPNQTEDIGRWIETLGRNNARWFDRMGFAYFTGEVYDAFYPGYGVSWPMYQGAVGATYEQASSRGLLRDRSDGTVLVYRDTVHHHFVASLSTAEMAATNREALLRDFYDFGSEGLAAAGDEEIHEVILAPGRDPGRVEKLVRVLVSQGIEVSRASEPFASVVRDYHGGEQQRVDFPAGSYRISMMQPAGPLARVLLAPDTPMDEEFLREQRRRYARREGDQIYDISGWSLPLLFDLEAYTASEPSTPEPALARDRLAAPPATPGAVHGGPATVAYLVPWGTQAAAEALAAMHHHGLRVHSAGDPFRIGDRDYPAGSLILRTAGNPDDLHAQLERIAEHHGVDIWATDTSWVQEGVSFGSGRVRYLPPPRVAIAWDRPTSSYSAGWARFLLEIAYGLPVTIVRTEQLVRADLDDYGVIVLPDAFSFGEESGYAQLFDEEAVEELQEWIGDGGTLVALGAATRWATGEEVGLLPTSRKRKQRDAEADPTVTADGLETGLPAGVLPEEEEPTPLPGSILRAQLDPEHWLAFGYGDRVNLIAQSRDIYEPLTLDQGLNVATYVPADEGLLVSGVAWPEELGLIAGTPFLMHRPVGRGHVVAFVEDPNFRAYFDGLNLLFLNAVLLGPGY